MNLKSFSTSSTRSQLQHRARQQNHVIWPFFSSEQWNLKAPNMYSLFSFNLKVKLFLDASFHQMTAMRALDFYLPKEKYSQRYQVPVLWQFNQHFPRTSDAFVSVLWFLVCVEEFLASRIRNTNSLTLLWPAIFKHTSTFEAMLAFVMICFSFQTQITFERWIISKSFITGTKA